MSVKCVILFVTICVATQVTKTSGINLVPLEIYEPPVKTLSMYHSHKPYHLAAQVHRYEVVNSEGSAPAPVILSLRSGEHRSSRNLQLSGARGGGGKGGGGGDGGGANQHTPRILYQVGTREEDLPICAPNAVCSKIDLYDTPWIERQCRCPQIPSYHHHKTDLHLLSQNDVRQFSDENHTTDDQSDDGDKYKLIHLLSNGHDFYETTEVAAALTKSSKFFYTHVRHHRRSFPKISGCSRQMGLDDGHTILDKTREYKLCDRVYKLPTCRYFQDYAWTLVSSPDVNITEQRVHCRCPKNSVTYLIKREPLKDKTGNIYYFACSPQSRSRCLHKEPCKLFTVRKRLEAFEEVNTNPLCQCPQGYTCPKHHTESGVINGKAYAEDNIKTFSGYCLAKKSKTN